MGLELHVTDGPDRGRVFRYDEYGSFVFGRAGTPDRDLQLPTDGRMSRLHLVFDVSIGSVRVRAVKEQAELRVGGRPVHEARLEDEERIELGQTKILVRILAPEPAPADAQAEAGDEPSVVRRRLSEFVLEEEIGRGALGCVYLARDGRTGEQVAIKRILADHRLNETAVAYFLREMDIVARLDHPNIVRTYCVGRERGDLFIGMEYIEGANLQEQLDMSGRVSPQVACAVGMDILRALDHAHGLGIVHRDVKPSNVMLDEADGRRVARLLDFGVARELEKTGAVSLTITGDPRGTPLFAAPECLADAKRAGPAADLFGVGATLYYALTLAPWFDDAAHAGNEFQALLAGVPRPLADRRGDVPAPLVHVIERALERRPADRWPDAASMLAALVEVATGGTASVHPSA